MGERVEVLRWGYRKGRDPRITTHLGLVARALGANAFTLAGEDDKELLDNLQSVTSRFGGEIETNHVSGLSHLRKHVESGGVAVHLTMYGQPYRQAIPTIRRDRPLLIVVGGAKVPAEVFKTCQYNIGVGNQPHSEVAALALFMEEWFGGGAAERSFPQAQLIIEGTNQGKIVHDLGREEE